MAIALGMCFDRDFPAAEVGGYARRLEAAGIDELWLVEDCFYTTSPSLAATALAVTERLRVGLGVIPALARNPAITAMEIATLDALAPGRLRPTIGHGVQEWMRQIGERVASPLTALEETIDAVRRLLAGERVTTDGRYVTLDDVQLEFSPESPPALLAGVQRTKSLALAGRVADGVILTEGAGPTYVAWALDQAGRPDPFEVVTFMMLSVADDRRDAYTAIAPFVAGLVADHRPEFTVLPFFDEIVAQVERNGHDALVEMPPDYWSEIGAIGTLDDARAHLAALDAAGVGTVTVFPGDDLDDAHQKVELLARLAAG